MPKMSKPSSPDASHNLWRMNRCVPDLKSTILAGISKQMEINRCVPDLSGMEPTRWSDLILILIFLYPQWTRGWNHKKILEKDRFFIVIRMPDEQYHSFHGVNRNGNAGTLLYVNGNENGRSQTDETCMTVSDLTENYIRGILSFWIPSAPGPFWCPEMTGLNGQKHFWTIRELFCLSRYSKKMYKSKTEHIFNKFFIRFHESSPVKISYLPNNNLVKYFTNPYKS